MFSWIPDTFSEKSSRNLHLTNMLSGSVLGETDVFHVTLNLVNLKLDFSNNKKDIVFILKVFNLIIFSFVLLHKSAYKGVEFLP